MDGKQTLVCVVLVFLWAGACGGGTSGAPANDPGEAGDVLADGPGPRGDGDEAPPPDGCPPAPCEEGERRCSGYDDVEKCQRDHNGCLQWEWVETCTDDTCVAFYRCQDGMCVEDGPWPEPPDSDGDGFSPENPCSSHPTDCDDDDASVHPGAIEVCDGTDNDCDGETDSVGGDPSNLPECLVFYADRDQDGHGDPHDARCLCAAFGVHTAGTGDDCDDDDPSVPSEATGCVGGCPDGVPESPEVCDDGNTAPFDGCDACNGERNYVNSPDMRRSWDPAVAVTPSGLVVAWSGPPPGAKRSQNIYARLVAPDLTFRGDTRMLHDESDAVRGSPALAARADGGFLAAWDAWGVDGDEFSVHARAFHPTGVPVGPEVTVNEHWQARQLAPTLAVSGDVALLAWQTHDQNGDGYEVYARFLDVDATPIGPEFRVNESLASDQFLPVVEGLPGGAFAVAWVSRNQGPADLSVVLTVFDSDHQVRVPETVVSAEETGTEVALAASEEVVAVAYVERRSWKLGGTRWWIHVKFIRLDEPGAPAEAVVSPDPPNSMDQVGAWSPALARIPGGFFLVYLEGVARAPTSLRFDAEGNPVGGGSLYPPLASWPETAMASSGWPAVTTMPDGRVAVVHECSPPAGDAWLPHGLCLKVVSP